MEVLERIGELVMAYLKIIQEFKEEMFLEMYRSIEYSFLYEDKDFFEPWLSQEPFTDRLAEALHYPLESTELIIAWSWSWSYKNTWTLLFERNDDLIKYTLRLLTPDNLSVFVRHASYVFYTELRAMLPDDLDPIL